MKIQKYCKARLHDYSRYVSLSYDIGDSGAGCGG